MPTNSTTTIDIRTKADSKAADAMDRMAKATKQAAEQEEKYQKALNGRGGASNRLGTAAGRQLGRNLGGGRLGGLIGGQAGGALGGAGAVAGATLAIYAALTAAAGKAADALNTLNNGAMTAAQKADQFGKMLPGGETWIKFRDAITGVTESLRKLDVAQRERMLAQATQHEKTMATASAEADIAHQKNRAARIGNVAVPDLSNMDRSTYQGQLAYEEAATKAPAQIAASRAQAELEAARADMTSSNQRMSELEAKRGKLTDNMDKARAAEKEAVRNGNAFGADAGENRVERTEAGLKALQAEEAVLQNEQAIEEEINRQKQLGVQMAQKESEVRKAQNGLLKAELQLLQQKEQRQAGAATALGNMNPAQRAMAVNAVKMAQQVGDIGMLPPQMRALAQQVAPGFMQKMAETSGEQSDAFKQLQDLGVVDKGSLADTRKEQAKVQAQVEVNVNLDEQELAKKIADTLGQSLKKLIDSLDAKAKALGDKLRTGDQLRNAQL